MNAPPLPELTPRLRLRRLRAGDLQAFQAYRGDPELGRYQGWQPMDDTAALAFLLDMAGCAFCAPGSWFQLGIARHEDDGLVGDIGIHLHADGRSAEIGFTLARAAQGQGLASEAVRAAVNLIWAHTAAERVVGITDTRNAASVRLLRRVGLRPFSTLAMVFRGEACEEQFFVRYRNDCPPPALRPAVAADAPEVARVLIDSRRELMPFAPSAHSDDEVRAWVREVLIPSGGVTVACFGDRVAGVMAVSLKDSTKVPSNVPQSDAAAWIEQLCVHPTQVARGAGRALLAHALATLPRPLQLYTFQANRHARDFYERHGFAAVAFGDGAGNEERCPDVLYRLDARDLALRSPA